MDSTQTNFRCDEESRSARNEDHNGHLVTSLGTRTEEEKQRRIQKWLRQQELERQCEKLKQQKILEYEEKRAQALKLAEQKSLDYERKRLQDLKLAEQMSSHHSQSRSDSKSPSPHQHRRSTSNASKSGILYKKLDGSSSGAVPLFKGPQGISITELRRIQIDIRRNINFRNIPAEGSISELQRDIVNPEDVVIKRREGEGCKPIFDREEIKTSIVKTNEVEEQRTITVDRDQPVSSSNLRTSRKHSSSLSFTRNRSYSPEYLPSYQSNYRIDSKRYDSRTNYHDHRKNDGRNSVEKRREHKERYTERDANKYTNRSRSRERDPCTSNSRSFMEYRTYRDRSRRERSSERSREKKDRDRSREKKRKKKDRDRSREKKREKKDRDRSRESRNVTLHYDEPVHMPVYYGIPPIGPRSIVVNPMVPFRGLVPPMGRGGPHPGLMPPFLPRFIPPDIHRLRPRGGFLPPLG